MNVLFLTLVKFNSLKIHGIYTDILRAFIKQGHNVYVISPIERREKEESNIICEENAMILRQKIGNIQKTNIVEKGISTILLEHIYKKAIRRHFSETKFDLIIYSTPPITLVNAVKYVKMRDHAKTYLLLKDIFPQNALDIGMLSVSGLRGILYNHFREQEKKLYQISDRIGCMSQANVDYVIQHNPEINPKIVEICPNCIDPVDKSVDAETRDNIRLKYGIPDNKMVFVYGGNLGKPQGIPFLIECVNKCQTIEDAFFLIVGDGTEYHLLEEYVNTNHPKNMKLMKRLPKDDYDTMIGACNVGLIFLDHRFTIPNFPSRMLSYMAAKLPVLACTDPNTDIGNVIVDGGFGWWCESNDAEAFVSLVRNVVNLNLTEIGINAYRYLEENYTANRAYSIIVS